jgi:hypothetical protein
MQVPCRLTAAVPSCAFPGASSCLRCHCGRSGGSRYWIRDRLLRGLDLGSVGRGNFRIARQGNRRRLQRYCWCQERPPRTLRRCWSVGPPLKIGSHPNQFEFRFRSLSKYLLTKEIRGRHSPRDIWTSRSSTPRNSSRSPATSWHTRCPLR